MSKSNESEIETLCVGRRVRVLDAECKSSCAATISYVHDSSDAVDVILDGSTQQEECNVVITRLSNLFLFETRSGEEDEATACKEYGNQLFGAKDFDAASKYYLRGINRLNGEILSVGSQVLVLVRSEYVDGMVSSVDSTKSLLEVELDDEEEVVVSQSEVIRLRRTIDDLKLQRSLYLNLAKCSHKKSLKGWAVRYSGIAIAIVNFILRNHQLSGTEEKDLLKAKADSHYFRGKVLIEACRPYNAEKVSYHFHVEYEYAISVLTNGSTD